MSTIRFQHLRAVTRPDHGKKINHNWQLKHNCKAKTNIVSAYSVRWNVKFIWEMLDPIDSWKKFDRKRRPDKVSKRQLPIQNSILTKIRLLLKLAFFLYHYQSRTEWISKKKIFFFFPKKSIGNEAMKPTTKLRSRAWKNCPVHLSTRMV